MSNQEQAAKIAFLGTGLMGQPMATRLLQAGLPLIVWNRTRARTDVLAARGAQVASSAAEAISNADLIITMLEDGVVVAAVITDALSSFRRGAMLVDMSSTRQSEAQKLHAVLAKQGIAAIDAPVSGGVIGAENGTLAIMAGGSAGDFSRAEEVLKILGRPTLVGPAGCGQLAKLCNQLIVGATLNIVAEALLLAQAGGADPSAVRSAIRGGFAESRILEVHGQRMLERNFLPGGQVKSQTKDLENVLLAAAAAGLKLPMAEMTARMFRSILPSFPHADQSAALLSLEQMNPGKRLGLGSDHLPE